MKKQKKRRRKKKKLWVWKIDDDGGAWEIDDDGSNCDCGWPTTSLGFVIRRGD